MIKKTILGLSLIVLASAMPIMAQVTIGSGLAPAAGSLLDLKQNADGSSTLGLGLPRVVLSDLSPTTNVDLAKSIGNTTETYNMAGHVGLVVYNVKDAVFDPSTCITTGAPVGLYVWDGSKWQGIGVAQGGENGLFAENIDTITGIGTVTDYEGNVYPTKRWTSTDGGVTKTSGIWMTKNLHSLRKADGTPIDCVDGMRLNPAYYYNATDAAIVVKGIIPSGTVGDYTNAEVAVSGQSYADYAKDFGLSYSYDQAVNACPRGWHLPNDAEWVLLVNSMYDAANGVSWGNIGHIMKASSNKNFISADGTTTNWAATTVVENGFNALPSGYVDENNYAYSLGSMALWWSATTNGSNRYVHYFNSRMLSDTGGAGRYYSVRCVRD